MKDQRLLQMGAAVRGCFGGAGRHEQEMPHALITLGRMSALTLSLAAVLTAPGACAGTITVSSGDYTNPAGSIVSDMLQLVDAGTAINDGTLTGSSFYAALINRNLNTMINNGLITSNGFGIGVMGVLGTLNNNSGGTINTPLTAIFSNGSIGTLNNTGVIDSAYGSAILLTNGRIDMLNNHGSIGAISNGNTAFVQRTSIGTLANSGYIRNVLNWGTIDALENDGNLDALNNTANGSIFHLSNRGTINTVANSGTLSSLVNNATIINSNGAAIANDGLLTSLVNASQGKIVSSASNAAAISNAGTVNTLTNAGAINGAYGISNAGAIGTLNNSDAIVGAAAAISNAGTISTLNNSGAIVGGAAALRNLGAIGSLNNSGVISGGTGFALSLEAGSTLANLTNTGAILGTIRNVSGSALTISGATGALFGTLTGANGGTGAGDAGLITSSANVVFDSGNQLLNDNISVSGGAGTASNTGVLQINNPISITGNFVQGNGANLLIGILNPSASGNIGDTGYGRLIVNGNATLDGSTLSLKPLGYRLAQGQRYIVLAATGSLSAAGVTYSAGSYTVISAIQADTGNAAYRDLVLTLGSPLAAQNATTSNALSSLNGLFRYTGTDSSMLAIFNPAAALDTPQSANKAGAQLSPAAVRDAAFNTSVSAFDAVRGAANEHIDAQRMAQVADGGVSTGETSLDPALWGRFFGGNARQGERDGGSGYHATYTGFLLGSDLQARPDWRIGGLFSYSRTRIGNDGDNSGSSASVNAYGLTAYAGYDGKPWYMNVTAGAARQLYSTTRSISYTGFGGVAHGSFKGNLYAASAQAGYPLALGDAVLTPMLGLRYSNLRQDGYTETGGNGAALIVASGSGSSLKSEAAVKYERSLQTSHGELKPFAQLGWGHEFRAGLRTSASFAGDTTGTTSFTAAGVSPLRNTALLSLGATLLRSRNLSAQVRYTLEAGRAYTAQSGEIALRYQY